MPCETGSPASWSGQNGSQISRRQARSDHLGGGRPIDRQGRRGSGWQWHQLQSRAAEPDGAHGPDRGTEPRRRSAAKQVAAKPSTRTRKRSDNSRGTVA
jgi:hypothetical protein